jgi:hypothetical protein
MTATFENRSIQRVTVDKADRSGEHVEIHTTDHTGFRVPLNAETGAIAAGDVLELETRNWSMVTGLRRPDSPYWMHRKSDEQLEAEANAQREAFAREKAERLEKSREDWTAREANLPPKMRERLTFWRKYVRDFDVNVWGYELIVCELAAIIHQDGFDSPAAKAHMEDQGMSGNQVDCARALARQWPNAEKVLPALTPLMSSADFDLEALERDNPGRGDDEGDDQ